MVNLFKKSCPLFLLFITACGKNFAIDDLGLTLASLRLNPQLTNQRLVTLNGTCDPTKGIVTITPDVDPVSHIDYFAPASLKVTCKSPGNFSADVTLSSGDGLKSALLVQEKDTVLGAVRLDMTSPDKPVVTSPVNGEKITTKNLTQNLVPKVSGTGEVDATVKVTSLSSSCATKVDASGKWSCFLEPLLPNGVHMMNVSQVDLAGNTSAVTSLLVEVISNGGVTPSSPSILTPVGGIFLKDVNQTLTGQCDSTASVVNVTGSIVDDSMFGLVGNKSIVKTTCSGAGTYSVSLKLVAGDGVKNISVSQIVNGSASYPTTATYILDTVIPAAPVISNPLAGTNVIDTTPVVRGTGLAGSFVKVKAGVDLSSKADATCEATVAASGNWFCELYPAITPPSVIDIEVTQEDLASNPSIAAKSLGVKVDPTLLASPTIIAPAFGSFLSTLTSAVSGTCTDGNTVTFIGNITPAVSVVCAGGTYTANVTFVAGEGSKILQATQTDSNGVVSLPSVVHYMFDNVPPSIPVVTSPAEGVFVNNNQTTISGTGVVSSIVTVTATGGTPSKTSTCQATVNNSNKWSCSLSDVLNDGAVTVSAVQADSAGNVSASSSNVSFTIDTSIPSSPTVDDPTSGVSLNLAAQKIKGTCTNGLIVELRGNIIGSPVTGACAANQFEINVQLSQENKLNTIAALQRNQAGTASPSVSVSYKWDTLAPSAPVVSSPPDGSIISDKTPTVSGTGEAGATVYVTSLNPNNSSCIALVNPNKTWTCNLGSELSDDPHTIEAYQKDLAGNESPKASVNITIDSNAGAAPSIQDPASGATLASGVQDISVSCLKDMTVKLTGNILNSPVTQTCTSSATPEKIRVTFTVADGAKSLQATQVDGSGAESSPSVALYVLDTSVPSGAPTIASPLTGSYLQTATPSVWGASDPDAKIKVKVDGTLVCSVSSDSSGSWFCPATQTLSKGSRIITATQTDSANHESAPSSSVSVVVDLDNPTGLTIATPIDKSTLINLNQTISGVCESAATISLTGSFAESPLNTTCAFGGTYSEAVTFYPGDGLRSIQAIQVDPSGRTQGPVKRYFYVDTNSPLAPMISSPLNNSFTSNTKPSVLGIGEVGATLTVTDGVGGSSLCVATVNSAGNWSCTSSVLAEGAHTLVATQTDVAANPASGASNQVVLNVDTTSPDAPAIESPVDLAYVGSRSQILEGTCEEGAVVSLSGTGINPRPVLATCANAKFAIHVMLTATDGDKTVTISQKDAAGNSTGGSDKTYKLKTSSSGEPTITGPVDGSILNAIAQDIEGACSEGATVKLYGQFTVGSSIEVKSPLTKLCPNTNTYNFSVKFTSVNGSKNIYVSQTDPAGNTSNLIGATYILDTVNPSVSINSLVNISSSNKASYLLSGTCSENGKVVNVSVNDTDGSTAAITATPNCSAHVWSVTKDLSSLIDGPVTVAVSQLDAANNLSGDVTATTNKYPDVAVPQIALKTPATSPSNSVKKPTFTITAESSGVFAATDTITLHLNSQCSDSAVGSASGDGSGSVDVQKSSDLSDGDSLSFYVKVTGQYGNLACSSSAAANKSASYSYDATSPIVEITSNLSAINFANKSLYGFSGTCSENGKEVTVVASDSTNPTAQTVSPGTAPLCKLGVWSVSGFDLKSLIDGDIKIKASQTDAASNVGSSAELTVLKDGTKPEVVISSYPNVTTSNVSSYSVSGSCTAGDGSVSVRVTDASNAISFSPNCESDGSWIVSSANLSSLGEGEIKFNASQTDAAGNKGEATQVTANKDSQAPVVTIASPAVINSANKTKYTLSGTCTENGLDVTVNVGGKSPVTAPTCTSKHWSIVEADGFDVGTLADGTISISVSQTDAANNIGSATATTSKGTVGLELAVTVPASTKVNSSNYKSFALTGTCGAIGRAVELTAGTNAVITPATTSILCGPGGTWVAYLSFTGSPEGNISVNVNHSDSYGNAATQVSQALTFDITPPSAPKVTLSSPAVSPGNDSTPELKVTATSGNYGATDMITLHLVAGCVDTAVSAVVNGDGSAFKNVTVTDSMAEGQVLKYYARVEDAAGNSSCSSVAATNKYVTYTLDTTAPVLTFTSVPAITSVNKTKYTLSGTCTENGNDVSVKVGGLAPTTAPVCTSSSWSIVEADNFDVSAAVEVSGSVSITVSQTDAAGNTGAANATTTKNTVVLNSIDIFAGSFESGAKINLDVTASYLKLSSGKSSGLFTSRIMDYTTEHEWLGLEWKTTMPFGKELATTSELVGDYTGIEASLMDNVLAIWHMNDLLGSTTAVDSKNAYDLTVSGDISFEEKGKLSKSARFYNGYMTRDDSLNQLVPSGSISIQAWVNPDYSSTVTGSNKIILEHESAAVGVPSYYLGLEDGKPVFKVYNISSNEFKITASSKLAYGKWSHIVAVFDDDKDEIKLYVNNIAASAETVTDSLMVSGGSGGYFYLGGDGTTNFEGYIDEVAIWNKALTDNIDDDQISSLYRRGVNRIKFQVRGCAVSTCSGAAWVGPDGTSSSYFSELINGGIDLATLDPLGNVLTAFPAFSFASYLNAGLSALNTQYIQYRAIFQTDDLTFSPELKSVEIKQ